MVLAFSRSSILATASVVNLDFQICASAAALAMAFCTSAFASFSASIFSLRRSRSDSRARNLPRREARSRASESARRRVSSS